MASQPILRYFGSAHLPTPLARMSNRFERLALDLAVTLPDSPETSACLRKLLEAKDCAVRSAMDLAA